MDADLARRDAVLDEVRRRLDRHNRLHDDWIVPLPPIESAAGPTDMQRLAEVEGLVRAIRVAVLESGEVQSDLLISATAQLVAWTAALDERSECKVVPA